VAPLTDDDDEPLPLRVQGGHLAQARRRFGLSAGIYIYVYQMAGSPRLQLPAPTLRRLAALDVWLDCEQEILY
jgi:hypothetical protein